MTALVTVVCISDVFNTTKAYAVQSVPYQMNFQGRLNNASGAPMAAGAYNMKFTIYSVSTGGTALWTETHAISASQGVTVTAGGLFSTQLGSVTSLPSSIFNSTTPLYLEVELPTPASATGSSPSWTEGAMAPRNPIESSPYAINSDLLDGMDSSAFAPASGSANYAAASGSANYIQNSTSPQTGNFKITGTGTAASLQAATFDTASTGTLTVGGSNASAIVLGSTSTNTQTTINGTALIKPTAGNDSMTAFLVQNAAGASVLNVDTSHTALNIRAATTIGGVTVPGTSATVVQHTTSTTATATFASNTTVGNTIVIDTIVNDASNTVLSVSGGGVTSWHKATAATVVSADMEQEIWYGTVATTGSATITVNNGSSHANAISATEVSGLTASPLDQAASTYVTPATKLPSTPTITTSQDNEIVFAFIQADTVNMPSQATPSNGFTPISMSGYNNEEGAYLVTTSAGPYSTSWTNSAADTYGASIVSFKAASGQPDILDLQSSTGSTVGSVGSTGKVLFQNSTNSSTAFQVQNAAGNAILSADTTNSVISVNGTTAITNKNTGGAAPVVVGETHTSWARTNSQTITTNSLTQTGDLVIITGYAEPNNEGTGTASYGAWTIPSGVTALPGFPVDTGDTTGTQTHRMYAWYYYATANGGQPLAFSNSGISVIGLSAVTIRGGATSGNPLADSVVTNSTSDLATGITSTPSVSLNLNGENSLVLWNYSEWSGYTTAPTPTGFTGVNGNGLSATSSKTYVSAGSTGSVSASVAGNREGIATALMSFRAPVSGSSTALNVNNGSNNQTFTVDANGNTTIATATNFASAFLVQNAAGVAALNIDTTTNTITLGSGGNTVSFNSAGLVAQGTARHIKTILLSPEYTGAVLDAASDTSCASANNGTLTSGYDSTNRMNFYDWTSTQATAQCYDVVTQIPIPSDFDGWASAPSISMKKDSTGTAAYAVKIVDSTGTTDSNYSYTTPGTLGTTWSNIATSAFGNTAGANGTTSYVPGNYFTIKIRMSSTSSANVSLGNIILTYNSKF